MIDLKFSAIRFSDSTSVDIPPTGVVLLVGPNNAGKSQTLRDLVGLSGQGPQYIGRAVHDLTMDKSGSQADFQEWVISNLPSITANGRLTYDVPGWTQIDSASISQQWMQPWLNVLASLFVYHADATSRLTAGNSVGSIDFSTSFAQHPIQKAYRDGQLEQDLDRISREAFGLGISVDRYSGGVISLRVGEPPEFSHERGIPSADYIQGLHAMPRLEDQGDGVRSYVGLLLHILGGLHRVTLVDEPEAFLHPPQARRLGKVLAERAAGSQQVFMATHSSDVVQGALDSDAAVTIIRITRNGDTNSASILNSASVKELWNDPLLRYSNVLDGLFHDAVVLCESDSDCRYYAAVLDGLRDGAETSSAGPGVRRPQLLFTHCGGKARMASVVESLRAAGVPVVVVADFDVLKSGSDVSRLVTALGGEFSQVQANLNLVASALGSEVRPVSKIALQEELQRKLTTVEGPNVSKAEMEALRAVMRAESGWDRAKRAGIEAIPQGNPSQGASALLTALEKIGLLVVPVGELERFAPGIAGHGPSWVTEVLKQELHKTPGQAAKDFIEKIEKVVASRLM